MKFFTIIKENSTRVPGKNFVDLGGIPLWKHVIFELKDQDVYIDTDSKIILDECEDLDWVKAYPRMQHHIDLESDKNFLVSPVLSMIWNFLENYVVDEDEVIVTTHVTSPFIKLKTILEASLKLKEGYDSVVSCTKHQEFSYFKGKPINFNPEVVQKTQDLEPIVMNNGAFFIFTKKTFIKKMNRIGNNPFFYQLSLPELIEIDNLEDLEVARKFID